MSKSEFKVWISTSPLDTTPSKNEFFFQMNKQPLELCYDEVVDEAMKILEEKFPESFYPSADISMLWVYDGVDEDWFPVFPENSGDEAKVCREGNFKKALVLPYAVYSLTPEMKLFLALKDENYFEDDSEFDFAEMHRILERLGW